MSIKGRAKTVFGLLLVDITNNQQLSGVKNDTSTRCRELGDIINMPKIPCDRCDCRETPK
jgi:hypothetical protein